MRQNHKESVPNLPHVAIAKVLWPYQKKSKASDLFGYCPMNLGRCGKSMTVLKMLKGNHKFPYHNPLFFNLPSLIILDPRHVARAFASCRRSCPAGSTSFISACAFLRRPVPLPCWRSSERGRRPRSEPGTAGVPHRGPLGWPVLECLGHRSVETNGHWMTLGFKRMILTSVYYSFDQRL